MVAGDRNIPEIAYAQSRTSAYTTGKLMGSTSFNMAGPRDLKNGDRDPSLCPGALFSCWIAFTPTVSPRGGRMATEVPLRYSVPLATVEEGHDCFSIDSDRSPFRWSRLVHFSTPAVRRALHSHSSLLEGDQLFPSSRGLSREVLQRKAGVLYPRSSKLGWRKQ